MSDKREQPMPGPERLIPTTISGQSPQERSLPDTKWSPRRTRDRDLRLAAEFASITPDQRKGIARERYELHQAEIAKSPNLDELLEADLTKRGIEIPQNMNLSLAAIEEFQRYAREAQDLRRVVRSARDPMDKTAAAILFNHKKRKMDEYLSPEYAPSFEKSYREYMQSRNDFTRFLGHLDQSTKLENMLGEPAFASLPDDAPLDPRAFGRLEMVMRETSVAGVQEKQKGMAETLDSLRSIYAEGSPEFEAMKKDLLETQATGALPKNKKEIKELLDKTRKDAAEAWEDPMVRYFWQKRELETLLDGFAKGEAVLETQTVVGYLNQLHDIEKHHQRTTLGGTLVGPPGVGKTTLVHHYLEAKGRNYVYIDLSEDVTRYLLYGSKSIEFKSQTDYYRELAKTVQGMSDAEVESFVRENSKTLGEVSNLANDEATVILLKQLDDAFSGETHSDSAETAQMIKGAKDRLSGLATKAFHKELASEFSTIIHKNGWRDGMIVSALRRGDAVLFDEFNKNKNWSLIYGLLTAKPGEKWYFADNDEWIDIPKDWRMYFTGNIGRKHGTFPIPEALGSRASGEVIDVKYPPVKEEMQVFLGAMSNPEGDFLRPADDLSKVYLAVNDLFPKIRDFIEDKNQSLPISYRTIRQIGEKLVLYNDPETGMPVYNPTEKSFDQALYDVLVESYALYEDKTIPQEIVKVATSMGLMLDDSIKDKVEGWIGKETYEERKKTFADHKEDFDEIVKKIRGLSTAGLTIEDFPDQRSF